MTTAILQWAYAADSPAVWWQQRVLMVAYVVVTAAFAGSVIGQLRTYWQRRARVVVLGLVVVFVLALSVRLGAPASLMDIHYRLSPALYPEAASAPYGWGFIIFVRLLWAAFGPSDQIVFTANAIVGALAIFPLNALAERLGLHLRARFWAIVVFALMPLHVRFSHTDNQSIVEITLLLFALASCGRFVERGRMRDGLVTGLALGIASCCRPEALLLPLVLLSLLWAVRPRVRLRRATLAMAIALYLMVAGGHLLAMLHRLQTAPDGPSQWALVIGGRAVLEHFVFLSPAWTPLVIVSAIVIGLASPRAPGRSRIWLAAMSLGLGALVWGFSASFGGLLAARHQLRALPFAALLAGLGIALVLQRVERLSLLRPPRAMLLGGGGILAVMLVRLGHASAPTTLNLEYAFYAATIADVPDRCTIVSWFAPQDRSLMPPRHLSTLAQLRHDYVNIEDSKAACATSRSCFVYYRPASCFTQSPSAPAPDIRSGAEPQLDAPCEQWEAAHALTPHRVATLPAISSGTDQFTGSFVEVGWFSFSRVDTRPLPSRCEEPRYACGWGFTKAHTETIQRIVSTMHGSECRLRSVRTDRGRSQLLWSRDSQDAGSTTLSGSGCEPAAEHLVASTAVLRLTADDVFHQRCPSTLNQLIKALKRETFPRPKRTGRRY